MFSFKQTYRCLALPGGSWLQLEAVASREEQHRADAPTGYALLGSWRRGF